MNILSKLAGKAITATDAGKQQLEKTTTSAASQ
jgi:hypothetical protein